MSDFEDRLRAIAKEISGAVERNIDDVAETLGVDGERARQFAEAAGQWINDHVEGGEELFGRQPDEPVREPNTASPVAPPSPRSSTSVRRAALATRPSPA